MPETTACNMFKVSQLASGLGLQVICGDTILVSYFQINRCSREGASFGNMI